MIAKSIKSDKVWCSFILKTTNMADYYTLNISFRLIFLWLSSWGSRWINTLTYMLDISSSFKSSKFKSDAFGSFSLLCGATVWFPKSYPTLSKKPSLLSSSYPFVGITS